MKNCACFLPMIVAGFLFIGMQCTVAPATPAVTITVLDPRGEIDPPPVFAPRPRIADPQILAQLRIDQQRREDRELIPDIVEHRHPQDERRGQRRVRRQRYSPAVRLLRVLAGRFLGHPQQSVRFPVIRISPDRPVKGFLFSPVHYTGEVDMYQLAIEE